MDLVTAVVRDPISGLISPAVYVVLLIGCAASLRWRNPWLRGATVIVVIVVMAHREAMIYAYLRWLSDYQEKRGELSQAYLAGSLAVFDYAKATRLYSVGAALLLVPMAFVGLKRRHKATGP